MRVAVLMLCYCIAMEIFDFLRRLQMLQSYCRVGFGALHVGGGFLPSQINYSRGPAFLSYILAPKGHLPDSANIQLRIEFAM
jgi:hypothetical protein